MPCIPQRFCRWDTPLLWRTFLGSTTWALPCDDGQFNVGEFARSSTIGATHTAANHQSSFARTYLVTHLLGSVKRHLDSQEIDKTHYGAEGLQLHCNITALATAVQEELEQDSGSLLNGLWSSMDLCFSTLFMLYEAHCHAPETWLATSEQQDMQVIATDGLKKITRAVVKHAQQLKLAIEQSDSDGVSILPCECIFSATSMCVWFVGETGEAEASNMLAKLRSSLQVMQGRRRVATSMLEFLDWERELSICDVSQLSCATGRLEFIWIQRSQWKHVACAARGFDQDNNSPSLLSRLQHELRIVLPC